MNGSRWALGTVIAACTLVLAACSSTAGQTSTPASKRPAAAPSYAVGVMTETFVDTHRATPANGPVPARPDRTLVTTIWYPAEGNPASSTPVQDAAPDRGGGPYPLIGFAHGLGATPQDYQALLSRWAAAGYVVAAPTFPLTSTNAPGGLDAADVVNQPGDMSYVISSVLRASSGSTGTLAGLVNPAAVGAAGHSNGAITTLGLVSNTCCRDPRVKAAAVLAGDPETFTGGHYDFAKAPPLLLVHGTDDALIPYTEAVDVFNRARGPKGLLTVRGGTHVSWLAPSNDAFPSVLRATTDFFDAYLRNSKGALDQIASDGQPGVTTMRFDQQQGSTSTITTVPPPKLHLRATVMPDTNLTDGQTVTVRWSGYTAGKVVNILQCSAIDKSLSDSAACDFTHAELLKSDPTGQGSLSLQVVEGAVGTGTCDANHQGCFIVVNNASSPDPASSLEVPISFAP